jgi:hypothetical protein
MAGNPRLPILLTHDPVDMIARPNFQYCAPPQVAQVDAPLDFGLNDVAVIASLKFGCGSKSVGFSTWPIILSLADDSSVVRLL